MIYEYNEQQISADKAKLMQELTELGLTRKNAQQIADKCAAQKTTGFYFWPTPDKQICVKSIIWVTPIENHEIDFLFTRTGRLVRTRMGKY